MIRWEDHRDRVERAVQMLIRDLHPDAQAIDGSGGDAGRDIRWDSPEGLVIFEVKSHVDLLGKSQKSGIKKSLRNAAAHLPVRWVLILPRNPTPAEERWFDQLRLDYSDITLEWRGRDWLDGQFAEREHLIRYVEGPLYVLGQRARELGHEQAVMANGIHDAIERLGVFSNRLDELSPFWRIDVSTSQAGYTLTYSERYPGAAADDPVSFTPTFSFPLDDPDAAELARAVQQVNDYGGNVTVPGSYISNFDVSASEETRRLFGFPEQGQLTSLEILSIEDTSGLPLPCTLTVVTPGGETAGALALMLKRRTGGVRGVTLSGEDVSGLMTINLLLTLGADTQHGEWNFTVRSPIGQIPSAIRGVADFMNTLTQNNDIELQIAHIPLGRTHLEADLIAPTHPIAEVIIAFDEAQKHFQQLFPIPDNLEPADLLMLRTLNELVQFGRARWPYRNVRGFIYADKVEDFLRDDRTREGHAILIRFDSFGMDFGDHRFTLGAVQFHSPAVKLTNRAAVEQSAGAGSDAEAHWTCVDNEHITVRALTSSTRTN